MELKQMSNTRGLYIGKRYKEDTRRSIAEKVTLLIAFFLAAVMLGGFGLLVIAGILAVSNK